MNDSLLLPALAALAVQTDEQQVVLVVAVVIVVILSLSVHEVAHGWVALKCGDPTARDLGRLSLNPIVHIDLFMTILLPAFLIWSGLPAFGGAKPVPVDGTRLRHPMRDMALVAIAGPLSNLILAVLFAFGLRLAFEFGSYTEKSLLVQVLNHGVLLNVVLAIFNMIPVPPLDGSRVMAWLLPADLRAPYVSFERFGMIFVLILVFTGAFRSILALTAFPAYRYLIDRIVNG